MVLIETICPYTNRVSYINPEYIMDITEFVDSGNKVYDASKIHVQGAMVTSYIDKRTPKDIVFVIDKLHGRIK